MKDSKEKEHRISNLKDMINKASNDSYAQDSFEDEYEEFENASDDDYEVVDAEEMINTLSKDYNKYPKQELNVDEEFIFKPGINLDDKDSSSNDEEIDDEFIIKTKLEDSELPKEGPHDFDFENKSDFSYDDDDFVSEKFDSMMQKKVRGYRITSIVSLVLGIIFILISIFLFSSSTQRIVDNVTSGEMNTSGVIFLLIGIFLLILGIYKMKVVKNPFEDVVDSIKSVEKEKQESKNNKQEETVVETIPLANDNKEVKKVGEFDISEFKNKVEQQKGKLEGVKYKTEDRIKNTEPTTPSQNEPEPSEEEFSEENEEIEYQKAQLDNESIDDIFADMEEIEEVPIISIDSKEK